MLGKVLQNPGVDGNPGLVGNSEHEGVGSHDRLIILERFDNLVRRVHQGAAEDSPLVVKHPDGVVGFATAGRPKNLGVTAVDDGEDRTRHRHARLPIVPGLLPFPPVAGDLFRLDITQRRPIGFEHQRGTHEVDTLAGGQLRGRMGGGAPPDAPVGAGGVRQYRQLGA